MRSRHQTGREEQRKNREINTASGGIIIKTKQEIILINRQVFFQSFYKRQIVTDYIQTTEKAPSRCLSETSLPPSNQLQKSASVAAIHHSLVVTFTSSPFLKTLFYNCSLFQLQTGAISKKSLQHLRADRQTALLTRNNTALTGCVVKTWNESTRMRKRSVWILVVVVLLIGCSSILDVLKWISEPGLLKLVYMAMD